MSNVLIFAKDLLFVAKLEEASKAQPVELVRARDMKEFVNALGNSPRFAVINLGMTTEDPFEAIKVALAKGVRVLCYFSHVQDNLAKNARDVGATEIFPRSKFVRAFSEILANG